MSYTDCLRFLFFSFLLLLHCTCTVCRDPRTIILYLMVTNIVYVYLQGYLLSPPPLLLSSLCYALSSDYIALRERQRVVSLVHLDI
jgi:hypothetical protein